MKSTFRYAMGLLFGAALAMPSIQAQTTNAIPASNINHQPVSAAPRVPYEPSVSMNLKDQAGCDGAGSGACDSGACGGCNNRGWLGGRGIGAGLNLGLGRGCDSGCDSGCTNGACDANGLGGCNSGFGLGRGLFGRWGGCGAAGGCDGNGGCDGSCDGGCGLNAGRRPIFGNLIMRSEGGFDCFISPITNPVYFEDPRLMTEARGIFLQHRAPIAVGGGDVQLYALQLRARLSENVAFIATKDGYITSSNPVIGDGWADTAAGLKFSLFRDPVRQRMWSAGFTYELASGEASARQGNGSGNLNLFVAGGRRIWGINWLNCGGIRAPLDTVDESTVVYSSQHFSKNIGARTWVLTEFNVQNWTGSGLNGIPGVEGGDLFNFGSTGVSGNTIVTNALGLKFRPGRNSEAGIAFEYPLTERRDIIDNRINVNWIWRY